MFNVITEFPLILQKLQKNWLTNNKIAFHCFSCKHAVFTVTFVSSRSQSWGLAELEKLVWKSCHVWGYTINIRITYVILQNYYEFLWIYELLQKVNDSASTQHVERLNWITFQRGIVENWQRKSAML